MGNINELEAHLKQVFGELLKTEIANSFAKKAGQVMKENVQKQLNSKGYSYNQSGALRGTLQRDVPFVQTNKTGSKISIGFGDLDEWNIETLRGPQNAVFDLGDGRTKNVRLRPEPTLPSWIIMEFGRREGNGTGLPPDMPDMFKVGYGGRDSDKKFMFGPSLSYHFRKPVFFMTREKEGEKHGETHPGIREGRFFRDGLKNSQEEVYELMLEGLRQSMIEVAARYGGTVE
jgi:hypothetical protein